MTVELALFDLVVPADEMATLWSLLDDEEQVRAAAYRFDDDRRRFVARRGRLRLLLAERLGCAPADIRYACNPYGKPCLADGGELRFSLSKSGRFALCATSWGAEVGCDIERLNPALASPGVAASFFSPHEVAALSALSALQWVEGFFNCWTRKEAYVKALGFGLSYPLDAFTVTLAPGQPARLIHGFPEWSLESFEPAPGYVAAVASDDASCIPDLEWSWRTRQDSNLWPLPSEGSALSS